MPGLEVGKLMEPLVGPRPLVRCPWPPRPLALLRHPRLFQAQAKPASPAQVPEINWSVFLLL